ncbi:hypothetical protein AAFF_G00354260 [Aldrovandia affinis]|uniref:Uncharacterized protein n=1 Tax=Aldrovandia affinis TaxID=143900 RepID=A0AAD7SIK3_9TELE|nr:hypothetical protein AAFF_G00354260 [Aldrovandia affinis]
MTIVLSTVKLEQVKLSKTYTAWFIAKKEGEVVSGHYMYGWSIQPRHGALAVPATKPRSFGDSVRLGTRGDNRV